MNPAFRQPADLTDPAVVARECADLAEGMQQQAAAAASGSALGGHPNPGFYLSRVAFTLAAASKLLASAVGNNSGSATAPSVDIGIVPPTKQELPPDDAMRQPSSQQQSKRK